VLFRSGEMVKAAAGIASPACLSASTLPRRAGSISRSCVKRAFEPGRGVLFSPLSCCTLVKLPSKSELVSLIADLKARNIPIIAVEGVDPGLLDCDLPPLISKSRSCDVVDEADPKTPDASEDDKDDTPEPATLLLDRPVRSGQSIVFTKGDVTVMGSIASGAEVIAGGSIHVYGALLGRAMAGVMGNAKARIFCNRFDPELVAISGLYATVNETTSHLCGRPVQAWLDKKVLQMKELS